MIAHRSTLILLTVAAVCGAAAPSAPTREQAVDSLAALARDLEAFRDDHGVLPSSVEGLDAIAADPGHLRDPWGNPVFYLRVAGGYWLMSWGADGEPGGEGDAADVVHIAR